MSGFFNLENPIWSFMGRVWDVMYLSLLWLVCSIPIITIGASTTALYYVTLKMAKNEEGYLTKQFFKSFRQNFVQGTVIWILLLVMGILLGFNLKFYREWDAGYTKVMYVITFAFAWIYLMIIMYVFPILAQFDNTIKNHLLFSFMLGIKKLGWTILMMLITVAVIGAGIFFPPVLLVSSGVIAAVNSKILARNFKPYIEQCLQAETGQSEDLPEK